MAERRRLYDIYGRPKEARNKYGLIDINGSVSTGSSLFGSNESASNVGGELISIDDFRGATDSEPGARGLVPMPEAGQNKYYYLQGNGNWSFIPAAKWLKEFPESAGFEKSGLTIDGDFNVTKNMKVMNLEVEGGAHFFELVIDKIRANGGQMIVSPSLFHIDFVGEIKYIPVFSDNSPMYIILQARQDIRKMMNACGVEYIKCRRLYMRNDDGATMTENECQVGDMLRCRSFNVKPGVYHNVSNKDYWTFVCATENSYTTDPEDTSRIYDPDFKTEYTDDAGNTHTAFFVDVAYALKLQNGHSLPLGTKLKSDGTYEIPEGYTEINDAMGLKSVSQETLNGDPNAEDEAWDNEEFKDITNKVFSIRGIADQINDILN